LPSSFDGTVLLLPDALALWQFPILRRPGTSLLVGIAYENSVLYEQGLDVKCFSLSRPLLLLL
jgi:hypothetical protein